MKQFTEKETQIINRFNNYKAWARETLIKEHDLKQTWFCDLNNDDDIISRTSSKRYASLVKIGEIISEENFLDKLHAYGDSLCRSWYLLAEQFDKECYEESANWEQQEFESREDYNEYLLSNIADTDAGYDMLVVEHLVSDLYDEVLDEDYYLGY